MLRRSPPNRARRARSDEINSGDQETPGAGLAARPPDADDQILQRQSCFEEFSIDRDKALQECDFLFADILLHFTTEVRHCLVWAIFLKLANQARRRHG